MTNRRTFIKNTTVLTAAGIIPPMWGCKNTTEEQKTMTHSSEMSGDLDKFGIQLYTLRDVIPGDPKGTIEQLAAFGYNQIESYEGDQGIYWGMTPSQFNTFQKNLGIQMVSSHCNIYEDFDRKAGEAAEVGLSYLICPWIGPQDSVEKWKEVTDKFNECGEICQKHGIRFAYHNHAYSYQPFMGMIPQKYMMDNTDPDLVDHQMDIYWVVTSGNDPIEYLKKYSGRFKLCHIKDRAKDVTPDQLNASCTLGTGSIDFPAILAAAKNNGMEFFIMEQEKYKGTTPMESAKKGAAYLKELKFV